MQSNAVKTGQKLHKMGTILCATQNQLNQDYMEFKSLQPLSHAVLDVGFTYHQGKEKE